MRTISFVFISLIYCMNSFGQAKNDTIRSPAQKLKADFLNSKDSLAASVLNKDTLISHARHLSDEKFRTDLAVEKQKQKQIEDENFAMHHRWRSFNFQYSASIVIFILVILIVLSGLFFSGWQFSFTLKQLKLEEQALKIASEKISAINNQPADTTQVGGDPKLGLGQNTSVTNPTAGLTNSLKNELELSTTGIKVNSSVLGVIILVLSIAFFYLYIIYVYPIKYLSPQQNETTTESSTKK